MIFVVVALGANGGRRVINTDRNVPGVYRRYITIRSSNSISARPEAFMNAHHFAARLPGFIMEPKICKESRCNDSSPQHHPELVCSEPSHRLLWILSAIASHSPHLTKHRDESEG